MQRAPLRDSAIPGYVNAFRTDAVDDTQSEDDMLVIKNSEEEDQKLEYGPHSNDHLFMGAYVSSLISPTSCTGANTSACS